MTIPQHPGYTFDARPLTESIDRAQFSAWARQARANGMGPRVGQLVLVIVIAAFGLFVGIFVLVGVLAAAMGATVTAFVMPLLVLLLIGIGVWRGIGWWNRRLMHGYRLSRFAAANGMNYLQRLSDPQLPGMIFDIGSGRESTDLVRGTTPRFAEFANFQYTTGSGKNRTTHTWGYIAIKLDVPLPNIVLDAQANNGFFGSNLPATYEGHQRLSLEGDFDRSFTLYCPAGYERDALYLFTPDIMARFMDSASAFDVEIVDDWLFLYAENRNVSTLDPAAWAQAFGTVGAIITKLQQWARWRDDRLRAAGGGAAGVVVADGAADPGAGADAHADPGAVAPAASAESVAGTPAPAFFAGAGVAAPTPGEPGRPWSPRPGVAPAGRRLKRAFPWVSTLVFGAMVVGWFVFRFVLGN